MVLFSTVFKMVLESIIFALFLKEWITTSAKSADFISKGAIFKIQCIRRCHLICFVNIKLS